MCWGAGGRGSLGPLGPVGSGRKKSRAPPSGGLTHRVSRSVSPTHNPEKNWDLALALLGGVFIPLGFLMIDLLDVSCVCFDPDCCSAGEWLFRAVDDLARAIDVHAVSPDVFPAGLDGQGRFLEAGFSVRPNDVLVNVDSGLQGTPPKDSLYRSALRVKWLARASCCFLFVARSPFVLIQDPDSLSWVASR